MKTIGIDTGGTFTDLIESDGQGGERALKLPSTPADPGAAVRAGLAEFDGQGPGGAEVVHGTTVALNALLTGRIARTALIVERGFLDLIEIGRQDRPDLYALEPRLPPPLAPRELRFEAGERAPFQPGQNSDLGPGPEPAEIERLARRLAEAGVESAAICCLHSYAAPELERRIARALARPGLALTCSADLCREPREFERFSTALVNAAVAPLMGRYLSGLAAHLAGRRLWLLQQSGGRLSAESAAREPVRVLLSGPAGGAIGARAVAADLGLPAALSFDLGGTSTDVAFHELGPEDQAGGRSVRAAVEHPRVAGQPIAVPSLDIHTIGCGGGSLARVDAGGVLRVGPESAGADPGPVAYGRGEVPTLTDAHALLGHIGEGGFLAGGVRLDLERVQAAFERLGRALGQPTLATAEAVIRAARAAMARALKVMSLERGHDPRRLALIAFGGGGGLHAAELLDELGAPLAVVPRWPGALSAWGLTRTAAERSCAEALFEPLARWPGARRAGRFEGLRAEAEQALWNELGGRAAGRLRERQSLALRYRGQSYELNVPEGPDPRADFEAAHERLYGYRLEGAEVELCGLGLELGLEWPARPRLEQPAPRPAPDSARLGDARAYSAGAWGPVPRWRREALPPGAHLTGPARIEEYTATTWLPAGFRARVAAGGHLCIERSG
jgi:N-methylhydantoinase A